MSVEAAVSAAGQAPPAFLGPVAVLIVTAAVIGFVMTKVRVVPIVGFLAAGVLIGPAQLGLVANGEAVQAAAEIGVILLLFTIGIEFSLDRLARVWTWIALGGAVQLSLQILFSAVFFVSVGMLLDLGFVLDNLMLVLVGSLLVLVVKTVTTAAAVVALRMRWRTAIATGLLLAQVGEFSFVLLTVGAAGGLAPLGLTDDGTQTVVAVTVVLMVCTPLFAILGARLNRAGGKPPAANHSDGPVNGTDGGLTEHVVLLGWGPSALELASTLRAQDIPMLLTTLNPGGAAEATAAGHQVLRGDPTKALVLQQAGLSTARLVVVAEDEPDRARTTVAAARAITGAPIMVRPLGPANVAELAEAGADHVVDLHRSSGRALVASVLHRLGRGQVAAGTSRPVVDTSRVLRYPWPQDRGCAHSGLSRTVQPAAAGCVGCLHEGTDWVHLRGCLSCGYVGCRDSSPRRHARQHAVTDEHPLIVSLEPGVSWGYCLVDEVRVDGPVRSARERSLPPQ
ncbi:MAG: cation:proton antiporter [Actinomycetota bacterium]|nr:cation:proton antiporter [Actinomycetota bacterium]